MDYQCFTVEIKDKVAHIVLSRPEKRNSMNADFWRELPLIINDIDDGAKARAIVLSAQGPYFSSGLDLSMFQSIEGGRIEGKDAAESKRIASTQHGANFIEFLKGLQDAVSALEDCRIPVLCAIQGGCIGGAVDLITACDMRYATQETFFSIYEINVGMTADVGTFPRIVKLMPEGVVRELAYTGRQMPAQEAKEFGLVNRVFSDQEAMLEGVMEIAREIASKAPIAMAGCKRIITYSRDHNTADGLDYIRIWNASMLSVAEINESFAAMKEKREANYVDLPPRR